MEFLKFMFCLLIIMATAMMMAYGTTIRSSDRIVFRDSAETETHRNHRGRGKGYLEPGEFDEALFGFYPRRGPPQLPYVLPTSVQSVQQVTPVAEVSRPNLIYPSAWQSIINNDDELITYRLPSADKPSTTTPSYQNPRRIDLLYGSNLLEEEKNREGKSSDPEGIDFIDRGLFNMPKHCTSGQVLVNDRCRTSV